MDNKNQQPGQQVQIDISPEVARGIYSNFAVISHSHAEFVVDCASMLPGQPKAQVVSRTIHFSFNKTDHAALSLLRSTQSASLWLFRKISSAMSRSSDQSALRQLHSHRDLVQPILSVVVRHN